MQTEEITEITEIGCGKDPNLDAMGWYCGNSSNTIHAVAEKKANAWGIYDMHGNVWEWCSDGIRGYPAGSVTDPTGPSEGAIRVLRGCSFGFERATAGRRTAALADSPTAAAMLAFAL